jgi:hypothetical protein
VAPATARRPDDGTHTVVWRSQLWHLLDCFEQEDVRETIAAAATRVLLSYITCESVRAGAAPTLGWKRSFDRALTRCRLAHCVRQAGFLPQGDSYADKVVAA